MFFYTAVLRAVAEWLKVMAQKQLKMCVLAGHTVCVLAVV